MPGPAADLVVVFVTAPEPDAPQIARALVERRVAACVNIVPGLRSIYFWQGKIEDEREVLLVIKTTRSRFEELRSAVIELHKYTVPEVLALPVVEGNAPYCDWVHDSVGPPGGQTP